MTLTEIKALSDMDLDARLVEAFGWDFGKDDGVLLPTSLDAIAPLEAKTVEKVGGLKAARYLVEVCKETDEPPIYASARHRSEAVLACWEGE